MAPVDHVNVHHQGAGRPNNAYRFLAEARYSGGVGVGSYRLVRSPAQSFLTDGQPRCLQVCLSGHRGLHEVTDDDIRQLQALAADARARGWLTPSPMVSFHGDTERTACPGSYAYARRTDITQAFRLSAAAPVQPLTGGSNVRSTDKVDAYVTPEGEVVVLQADGGVFATGDEFRGSIPGLGVVLEMGRNHAVSILRTPTGRGYWILLADGGIFSFGDAQYRGNALGIAAYAGVAVELCAHGAGYSIVFANAVQPSAIGKIDRP